MARVGRWLAAMMIAALASAGAGAQEAGDPVLSGIAALAQTDPVAALTEIEAAISRLEAQPQPDQRVLFDLKTLKADLLEAQGRRAEAAPVLEQLGRTAARNRGLGVDPVPLWQRSSADYESAGALAEALRVEDAIYEELQDGGLPGPSLAPVLLRGADLLEKSGDAAKARQIRKAAEDALKAPKTGDTRGEGDGFTRVEVFYATDRARTGSSYPGAFYGAGRGPLEYGVAEVTIPDTHRAGAIEMPSIWKLEFGPSPAKHMMLRSVEPIDKDVFFFRMQDSFAAKENKEAVVFVHGYNVTFDAAAKRAAQLAHDMSFEGTPVLYSWPSMGSTVGYISDAAVVQLSARRLTKFLDDLVARSGATTIHIVAHSMGNRALTEALELMALRHGQTAGMEPIFGQVVFAAPDVDAGLFAEMLPTIRPLARRLTLYASENDWALVASRKLHGDAPRAGQGGAATLTDPAIDSVDMSALGEDMLAHGYFADDSSALVDLVTLIWRNLPPDRRCGLEKVAGASGLAFWRYKPGQCADSALLAVLGSLRQKGVRTPAEAVKTVAELVPDPKLEKTLEPLVSRLLGN